MAKTHECCGALSLRRTGDDLHVSLHKGFKIRLAGIVPVFIEFTVKNSSRQSGPARVPWCTLSSLSTPAPDILEYQSVISSTNEARSENACQLTMILSNLLWMSPFSSATLRRGSFGDCRRCVGIVRCAGGKARIHWSIYKWIAHSLCTAVKILKPDPPSYYSLSSTLCGFGSSRKIIKMM